MASSTFSLANQSLKLDTAESTIPHLGPLLADPHTLITEIRLNGNTLGVPAAEAISKVLRTQKNLQIANLADIFTARLLAEIPPALSALLTALLECPNLHTVDLSDNAFGLNTVAPLVAFLKAHVPLRHLILNNNGLGPNAGTLIAEALAELAEKKAQARREGKDVPALETIVCGRNRLESGSMAAWAKALGKHSGVKTVRMVQNGIRQEGVVTLLREGLRRCTGLEVLDLQDNTFTLVGSQALAEVVGGWGKLRELGVGDCLLGARGGAVLFRALGKGQNKGLRTLRLQFNGIDGKALGELVGAVTAGGLEGLRRGELNGNKFLEDDVRVLKLREVLDARREETGDDEGDDWGLDDLSDKEESDEDEDEDDEDKEEEEVEAEEEKEKKADTTLKMADEAENAPVSEEKDEEVDELAAALDKTL
ncbi:hypothetical protein MMC13_002941 [Lambiella insularis]|nr:hypothetical protein [Lambiella insularis]